MSNHHNIQVHSAYLKTHQIFSNRSLSCEGIFRFSALVFPPNEKDRKLKVKSSPEDHFSTYSQLFTSCVETNYDKPIDVEFVSLFPWMNELIRRFVLRLLSLKKNLCSEWRVLDWNEVVNVCRVHRGCCNWLNRKIKWAIYVAVLFFNLNHESLFCYVMKLNMWDSFGKKKLEYINIDVIWFKAAKLIKL